MQISLKVPGAATIKRAAQLLISSPLIPNQKRARALQRIGVGNFDGVFFGPYVRMVKAEAISFGTNIFINEGTLIDAGHVTLEDGVFIGPRCTLITANHSIGPKEQRAGDGEHSFITIKAGSWLGANVTVLPGVTIGEGCIIAAGAVVTSDCEPHGLYAGVPAVRKKDLPV